MCCVQKCNVIGMGVVALLCNSIFIFMQLILCYKWASFSMKVLARTGEHLSLLRAIGCETLKGGCAVSMIKHNGKTRLPHNE